jgi:hypothetical protein
MMKKITGALVALFLSVPAFAAVDVSASVTEIGDAKAAVLLIGASVFALAVGVKLYKWLRAAL